jgi:hypothetical protein
MNRRGVIYISRSKVPHLVPLIIKTDNQDKDNNLLNKIQAAMNL